MLVQSLGTDGALYMHHLAFYLRSGVDISRLQKAWEATVAELDVLRTTFHFLAESKTPWVGVVHKNKGPTWKKMQVSDVRQHWRQLTGSSDFVRRIQNVEPLASAQVVDSAESDPALILTLHHALYDGISLGMLYQHLTANYAGIPAPQTTPFYEAAKRIAQTAPAAVKYWAEQIKGYEAPQALSAPPGQSHSISERIIFTSTPDLERKCQDAGVDVRDLCVVAYGKAVALLYGQRDIVFGHVIAARSGGHISGDGNDIVGPMFNTVPFRVSLRDQLLTNQAAVHRAHAVYAGSLDYQHASLAEVQRVWRGTTSDSNAQLIDSIFVYSKVPTKQQMLTQDLFGEPLNSDKAPVPSEYAINFEVEHTSEDVVARTSSTAPTETIQQLLDNFYTAFYDLVDNPSRFATAFPEQLRQLPSAKKHDFTPNVGEVHFDEKATSKFADTIRQAMAEVAEVPAQKISLHSSIYQFGIDSIAGIQIASRCRKAGVPVSVADILRGTVLGRICEIVAEKQVKATAAGPSTGTVHHEELVSKAEKESALNALGLSDEQVEDVLRVLAGQEYHLLSWLQSGRTLYEPPWSYKSAVTIDVDKLEAAWRSLCERNAVLRTIFTAVGSEDSKRAVQVVLKSSAVPAKHGFGVINAHGPLLNTVKEQASVEARKPSDLFTPPVRVRLIKAQDGDAVMVYIHHALYDAWSMPRLVQELADSYKGNDQTPVVNFGDFVKYTLTSVSKEEEAKFWQNSLTACERTILAPSNPRHIADDQAQSFKMLTPASAPTVSDLESLASTHQVSPTHILLLSFARALARATGTNNPLFGMFHLGRSGSYPGVETLNFPCVNALPLGLRDILSSSSSAVEKLKEIQSVLGERVAYEQSHLRTAVQAFKEVSASVESTPRTSETDSSGAATPTSAELASTDAQQEAKRRSYRAMFKSIRKRVGKIHRKQKKSSPSSDDATQQPLTSPAVAEEQQGQGLPFNTYVNLLWHAPPPTTTSTNQSQSSLSLFTPLKIGVPTDFSSPTSLPGRTAVDGLEDGGWAKTVLDSGAGSLFVDIGPGENGEIFFGCRADAKLMDEEGIARFVESVGVEMKGVVEELRRDAE
jgi:ferricrocin synthase